MAAIGRRPGLRTGAAQEPLAVLCWQIRYRRSHYEQVRHRKLLSVAEEVEGAALRAAGPADTGRK